MVLIKNCFQEYKQKRISISTQKYRNGWVMEKYVLDLKIKMRNQKKIIMTTEVKDVVGGFVVELRGLNIKKISFIHNYL